MLPYMGDVFRGDAAFEKRVAHLITSCHVRETDSEERSAVIGKMDAMYAAVGAGIYETLEVAAEHMAAKCIKIYKPDSEKKDWYKKHYQEYLKLAEAVNKLS